MLHVNPCDPFCILSSNCCLSRVPFVDINFFLSERGTLSILILFRLKGLKDRFVKILFYVLFHF